MMVRATLRREEAIGLVVAVGLHVALIGALLLRPAIPPTPLPQRISVTLSPDAGPQATAPTHDDAAADIAPTLGAPPAAVVSPPPAAVAPPPVAKPLPAPKAVAVKPLARARPQDDAPAPVAKPAKRSPSVKEWALAAPATPDHQPAGGSRIGNDFLKGVAGGKPAGKAQQQGAAVIGPQVKSALSGAIANQLKPYWAVPQGVDADKLVTILSWDLNRDGSLAGPPHVVRQEGISDSNRPQAALHAENAINAVEHAAPFKLPPEYYSLWKHIGSSRFDRTLSQ